MTIQSVLLPVFLEVLLIFILLFLMAGSRMGAFKGGLNPQEAALGGDAFPARSRQYARAYANQFEMPVLFLIAVVLAVVVHQAGTLFVLFEWLFLVARIAHALIFVTSNKVPLRGAAFMLSAVCTAVLWILIAAGVLTGAL